MRERNRPRGGEDKPTVSLQFGSDGRYIVNICTQNIDIIFVVIIIYNYGVLRETDQKRKLTRLNKPKHI